MADVKKENWFKRTWGKVSKYFRELRSELKKVVWPTPQQVLKNTLWLPHAFCVSAFSSGCSTSWLRSALLL